MCVCTRARMLVGVRDESRDTFNTSPKFLEGRAVSAAHVCQAQDLPGQERKQHPPDPKGTDTQIRSLHRPPDSPSLVRSDSHLRIANTLMLEILAARLSSRRQ